MLCELKQAVPLLERKLTPVEIRIGWASARLGSLKQESRRFSPDPEAGIAFWPADPSATVGEPGDLTRLPNPISRSSLR